MIFLSGCGPGEHAGNPPAEASDDLSYRFERYMPGLQERVEYVKGAEGPHARRPGGERISIQALHRLDRQAWLERHGATTAAVVRHLSSLEEEVENRPVRVAVWFSPPASLVPLSPEDMKRLNAAERRAARARYRETLASHNGPLISRWAAAGLVVRKASRYIPVVFGNATPQVIERLSRDPDVRMVSLDESGVPQDLAAPNFVKDPNTDEVNNLGFYAVGERIGNAEWHECGVHEAHESLAFGRVIYSDPVPSCAEPQGANCLAYPQDTCQCVDGQCVRAHQSGVASVLMGAKDGAPWGAAEADLFQYNGQGTNPAGGFRCSPSDMDDAYDWFVRNDVYTVVQSWKCTDDSIVGGAGAQDLDGVVQDAYIRAAGITVVAAAGNQALPAGADDQACAPTLNSLCVGASHPVSVELIWGNSSWKNPAYLDPDTGIWYRSDREEPDLVALGVQHDMMDTATWGSTAWDATEGTSLSAAAVAGLVAVLKEACGVTDPRRIRARLQVASGNRNPDGWKYSSPNRYTPDGKDGAGGIDAAFAYAFCELGEGAGWAVDDGLMEIDFDNNGHPPFPWPSPDPADLPPGEHPRSYAPPASAERKFRVMGTFDGRWIEAGQRIRAVIAWNSCPAPSYQGPTAVGTDFDLFLVNMSEQEYVYMSQSIDDNTEGFDVVAPTTGTYTVFVAWPADSSDLGCPNDPVAWAWAVKLLQ